MIDKFISNLTFTDFFTIFFGMFVEIMATMWCRTSPDIPTCGPAANRKTFACLLAREPQGAMLLHLARPCSTRPASDFWARRKSGCERHGTPYAKSEDLVGLVELFIFMLK